MVSRKKLIDAAARIYSEYGFRGATTRRIADEAGVNEVTLFRLFGSKSQLIAAAIQQQAPAVTGPSSLPGEPGDPEAELTEWCAEHLSHLRASRSFIRKTLSEMEEHPEMTPCMVEGPRCAFHQLLAYVEKLPQSGSSLSESERSTAVAMLMGALFADAMGRDMMPDAYPQPLEAAPPIYARLFLRALGCEPAATSPAARDPAPTQRRAAASRSDS